MTPIIGATHGADYKVFAVGQRPTPGLETLSEMGKHSPLDVEINQSVSAGTAGSLIEFSAGSEGPVHAPVSHRFEINQPPDGVVGRHDRAQPGLVLRRLERGAIEEW